MNSRKKTRKPSSLQSKPQSATDAQSRVQQHQKFNIASSGYVTGGQSSAADVTQDRIRTAETNVKVNGLEKSIENHEKNIDLKIENMKLQSEKYTDSKISGLNISQTLGEHKSSVVLTVIFSATLSFLAIAFGSFLTAYNVFILPLSESVDTLKDKHRDQEENEDQQQKQSDAKLKDVLKKITTK